MISKVYFCTVGRILCLDMGKKRTGLAVTDPLRIVPGGLETVETSELMHFLKMYIPRESVDCLVVGYPLHLNGTESEMTSFVDQYLKDLRLAFPTLEINIIDERLSSLQAARIVIQSGVKKSKRKEKGIYDRVSAMVLLQSYLDKISNQ
jgi:putative holliday junction resolvase